MSREHHARIHESYQHVSHDAISQLRGSNTLPTFCADVTKLMAADSWLQCGAERDPEASTAFSELTTALANPVDIYFHKRRFLNASCLGSVAKAWMASANVDHLAQPSAPQPSRPINMNAERARWFAADFRQRLAHEAVRWVRFQASSRELMNAAWSENSEQEYELSYNALIENGVGLRALKRAFETLSRKTPFFILDKSNEALTELGKPNLGPSWDDEKLVIAYLAWTYIKGFRYVHTIKSANPSSAYLVHFTRKPAIEHETKFGDEAPEAASHLFPWGELMGIPTFQNILSEDYRGAVDSVRVYTRQELPPYLQEIDALGSQLSSSKARERDAAFRKAENLTREFAFEGLAKTAIWHSGGKSQSLQQAERRLELASLFVTAMLLLSNPSLEGIVGFWLHGLWVKSSLGEPLTEKVMLWNARREVAQDLKEKRDSMLRYLHQRGIHSM
jgi:hypothetical protein